MHHKKEQHTDWKLNIDLDKEDIQVVESDNLPAAMQDHFFQLNVKESLDGMEYLSSRGLTGSLCLKHKLMYSPLWRRVIFPIFIDNDLMGYQARAIDPVDKSDRMRNNPGFRKGGFVMFLDEAKNSDHLIIAEGPVDALKFSNVGGYVATLGKDLSLTQIEMINNHPAKKIYWALDSDALNLVEGYARMVDKESYLVLPTEDSEKRITLAGKKVDFGECTFDECEQAFKEARNINDSLLLGGLK